MATACRAVGQVQHRLALLGSGHDAPWADSVPPDGPAQRTRPWAKGTATGYPNSEVRLVTGGWAQALVSAWCSICSSVSPVSWVALRARNHSTAIIITIDGTAITG